ncbi:MAG: cytochrome c oxidase subunit II [Betaproteobacteria bacterium]
MQSILNPQGPAADAIAELSWVLILGAAAIFVAVMAIAAYALLGRRRTALSSGVMIVAGGVVFPVVTLSALLVYSLVRSAGLEPAGPAALRIEVTGEQWWWRVRYPDFETANEIRLPVGRPVELVLKSADVIHSFWVPALAGKLDMVPGRVNRVRVRADRPGEFRGQCAEYCGGPHGLMALYVVAVPENEFDEWSEKQQRSASVENPLFVAHCGACHTVRGTKAAGVRGPDLTHVGSRLSIGAGLLPNNPGALAAWIASSQHLKPGNLMPSFEHFSGRELRELAAYLEGLR